LARIFAPFLFGASQECQRPDFGSGRGLRDDEMMTDTNLPNYAPWTESSGCIDAREQTLGRSSSLMRSGADEPKPCAVPNVAGGSPKLPGIGLHCHIQHGCHIVASAG
jgi:hypothetical protein